jgi:glycine/sarcosine N-methyltransferase
MANTDPFQHFAAHYDWGFPEHTQEARFLGQLFSEHSVRTVLDCACGTGRDIVLLAKMGFQVWGSDISSAMLKQSRLAARDEGLRIPLQQADFRYLCETFDRRWDAIICLSTAIPQLPNRREVVKALRSMRNALNPGGILVLSQGMSDRLYHLQPREIRVHQDKSGRRDMFINYGRRYWKVRVVDAVLRKDRQTTATYSFRYLRLLHDDCQSLLQAARFPNIALYDGFSRKPYSKRNSTSMVVVAQV